MSKCIQFCHKNGVLHKDLKLENIMVENDLSVRLVDFGYSELVPRPKGKSPRYCGTPFYVPPEFIKKERNYGTFNSRLTKRVLAGFVVVWSDLFSDDERVLPV